MTLSRVKWTTPSVVKTQHSQVSYLILPNILLTISFMSLFIFGCIISLFRAWAMLLAYVARVIEGHITFYGKLAQR